MLLTIDVGNTNTVLGVFEGDSLRVHWRLTTRRGEYGGLRLIWERNRPAER